MTQGVVRNAHKKYDKTPQEISLPHSFSQWQGAREQALDTVHLRAPARLLNTIATFTRDRDTAIHLLKSTCRQYPTKDLKWCCEKVIFDLVRDRVQA